MKRFSNAAVVSLLAVFALAGCDMVDTMREGFAHSQAVSAELEKSLGTKSFVGFNWNNGELTSVEVRFDSLLTDHPLAEIAEVSRNAIRKEFQQTPKQIVISFTLTP
jgi:hypothetical protein